MSFFQGLLSSLELSWFLLIACLAGNIFWACCHLFGFIDDIDCDKVESFNILSLVFVIFWTYAKEFSIAILESYQFTQLCSKGVIYNFSAIRALKDLVNKTKIHGILYGKGICLVFNYYSWIIGLCGDLEIIMSIGVVIDEF